jgi:hypothetical protein
MENRGKKGGIYFIRGGMSFIGIIGMNSRYEAEIQILTCSIPFIFVSKKV